MIANLVTARNILENVRAGRIDVGPLDAYWHLLLARSAPQLTVGIRVLESTALAPMPAFVAAATASADMVDRLRAAFVAAAAQPWFSSLGSPLQLQGFEAMTTARYSTLLDWDRAAQAAGYDRPA